MTDPKSSSKMTHALPHALGRDGLGGSALRLLECRAVFLDYDGTLTPIVSLPELAVLSDDVRLCVDRLSVVCPVTIVTGRDVSDVRQLVGIDRLGYVGSHGLDVVGPEGSGLRREVAAELGPELDAAESEIRRRTAAIDGVLVERKRFSISTHVRLVDASLHAQVDAVVDAIGRAHPSLRREGGKMLYELRPDVDWDKGAAVRWLLDGMSIDPSAALYIGDDLTDETAFAALAGRGVTIVVADPEVDRSTEAQFRLDGPADVHELLGRLVHLIEQESTRPPDLP